MKLIVAKLPDHIGAEAVFLGPIHLFQPDTLGSLCRMYRKTSNYPMNVVHMGKYAKESRCYIQEYDCKKLLDFIKAYGDQVVCEGCLKGLRRILGNPPFILSGKI